MESSVATQRAHMPSGTNKVLDRRSLEKGNEQLIPFLKPGMRVLDVGCGSGTITRGMAARVGANGHVVGIDPSGELIRQAQNNFATEKNLTFKAVSLFDFNTDQRFDVVVAARTLQWLSNPLDALKKMKSFTKPGGVVFILDYNHEKIEWIPAPPASMNHFYHQFLAWRSDAGMHNQIADELPDMMEEVGLTKIVSTDASEVTSEDDVEFLEDAGIWTKVAELRGPQMVETGFMTDEDRQKAIQEYNEWLDRDAQSMTLNLKAVSGWN